MGSSVPYYRLIPLSSDIIISTTTITLLFCSFSYDLCPYIWQVFVTIDIVIGTMGEGALKKV